MCKLSSIVLERSIVELVATRCYYSGLFALFLVQEYISYHRVGYFLGVGIGV